MLLSVDEDSNPENKFRLELVPNSKLVAVLGGVEHSGD